MRRLPLLDTGRGVQNIFLIGGAPSSGSTLLVSLLARQERVLCLPETGLFAHGRNLVDMSAPADARRDLGWNLPWLLTGPKVAAALGWPEDHYAQAAARHRTAFDLLRTNVDPEWRYALVEKTPENVFAFREYLSQSRDHRVVVTWRDVLGVAQSLLRRGFNLIEALLAWFAHSYETARLIADFPDQVFHCRYDRLTAHPHEEVARIITFLNIGDRWDERSRAPLDNGPGSVHPRCDVQWNPSREGVSNLLAISSWGLSSTSWSHSPGAAARPNPPQNYLGQDFGMVMHRIAFKTDFHGLVQPGTLNDALLSDPDLLGNEELKGESADCELRSTLTRVLAEHYQPTLLRI